MKEVENVKANIVKIELENIKESKFNVRREYGLESLDISEGYIHKPKVIAVEEGIFEIVVGHRRIQKARNEGLTEIECEVVEGLTDKEILKEQAKENLQRKGWTPIEEGRHFEIQRRLGLSVREIADNIRKSERYVQLRLFLLNNLNPYITNSVRYPTHDPETDAQLITFQKAIELARLPEKEQKILSDMILKKGLTISSLKRRIEDAKKIEALLDTHMACAELNEKYVFNPETIKKLTNEYLPKKYERETFKELKEKIKELSLSKKSITVYLPKKHNDLFPPYDISTEGFNEEEAQEYARKHHGFIVGEKTYSFYEVQVNRDEDMRLAYVLRIETSPIKIHYRKKRCEKCGKLIEQRMYGAWCANCVYQSKRKELDELRRRR